MSKPRRTKMASFKFIMLAIPLIFVMTAAGCQSGAKSTTFRAKYSGINSSPKKLDFAKRNKEPKASSEVHNVLKTAFSQVGNPYRYGGNTPETGFDCSGFVKWVYSTTHSIQLPRTSSSMIAVGTPVDKEDLRPGDLVFFGKKRVSHVGIYTGDNKYIHSPRTGRSIKEDKLTSAGAGRGKPYLGARRIINNENAPNISDQLKTAWVAESREQFAADSASQTFTARTTAKNNKKAVKTAALNKVGTKSSAKKPATAATSSKKNAKATSSKTAKQGGSAKKHTVKSGDTVFDLSRKYGVSISDLSKANKLNGKGKSQLKLGQVLVVPKKSN